MKKTAIIVGATGLTGKYCLSYLLMDPDYENVIAISRKELPHRDSKLKTIIASYEDLEKHKDLLVGDDVYCCLGTTIKTAGSKENFKQVDLDYPVKLAEITQKNGATKFLVVSALGADKNSSIFYNKIKGEMEDVIQKLPFESVHIFRPSLLTGNRSEFRLGESIAQILMKIFKPLMVGGLNKYKAIDAMVVAHAMHHQSKENQTGTFIYPSEKIQEIYNNRKK